MTRTRRTLLAVITTLLVGIGLLSASTVSAEAARPSVTLNTVGSKYVGKPIPVIGYLNGTGARRNKNVYLQRQVAGTWHAAGRLLHRRDGRFRFPNRYVSRPQVGRWRVVVKRAGHVLDVSNTLVVRVIAVPVDPDPPTGGNAGLPDLVVLNLNSCSDAEDTNPDPEVDNCFRIDDSTGRKLLKFPAVTANQGAGDLHIEATRSSTTSTDWQARQILLNEDGTTSENFIPAMEFYFAQDGHSHWHIRDFDSYQLLDAAGVVVQVGEKHGFCLEDNRSLPGVTSDPVFTHDVVCGVGDQNATTITHGLSAGWGDTYPSSLPDQAIDITGLPDGVYTVRVRADGMGLVRESDNTNNAATVQVSISGGGTTVTPVA